jgi:hypothetical protein
MELSKCRAVLLVFTIGSGEWLSIENSAKDVSKRNVKLWKI